MQLIKLPFACYCASASYTGIFYFMHDMVGVSAK